MFASLSIQYWHYYFRIQFSSTLEYTTSTTSVQEFIQEEEEEEEAEDGRNGGAGGGDDLSLSDFHLQVLRRMEIELTVKDNEEN